LEPALLRKLFDRQEQQQQQSIWTAEATAQPRGFALLDTSSDPSAHVMLRKRPYEIRLQVVPGSEVTARIQTVSNPDQHGTKAGIIWVKFLDVNGNEVASRGRISKGRQGNYIYIVPDALGLAEATLFVPTDCTEVILGFALWKGYPGSLSLGNGVKVDHSVLPPFAEIRRSSSDDLRQHRISISRHHNPASEVELLKEPLWLNVSTHDSKHFSVQGQLVTSQPFALRDAIVLFKFDDQNGSEVGSLSDIPRGQAGEYLYIEPDSAGSFSFEVHAPADCASVRIGFAAWRAAPGRLKILNALEVTELAAGSAESLRPGYGAPQSDPKALRFDRLHELGTNVAVTARARWTRIPIAHVQGTRLQVKFAVVPRVEGLPKKSALTLIEFADEDGTRIVPAELSTSKHGSYKYIDGRHPNDVSISLSVPRGAAEIRVGTMLWEASPNQLLTSNQIWVEAPNAPKTGKATGKAVAALKQAATSDDADTPRRARDLKVALIADEFTYNCFKYEFNPIIIEPQNWRARFEEERPDVFFCESAWSGVDSEKRPWKGRIYASSNFARENRTELLEILEWCNSEGVPTVFWNKEDPTHFDDKIHNFIDTAVRFDHVFTTDVSCVPRYEEEYGHPSVHCLPFATQPKLFNPIQTSPRAAGVSFAGSWYANHVERSAEMEVIFDQILEADLELRIFDRFWGSDDELHHFPERYRHLTNPAVPHSKIAEAYKSTTLGLNINTVTSSPTMFARRIFELMSCNTLVVSNYSRGVADFFDGRILFAGDGHSDIHDLDTATADLTRHAALHDVLANHTYERRFEQILDSIGFTYAKAHRMVTLVVPVESEAELNLAIARQGEFVDVVDRLVIVLGRTFQKSDAAFLQAKYGRFGVVVLSCAWAADESLDPSTYLSGDVFALISPDSNVSAKTIYEATLHRAYVEGPVVMQSGDPYRFSTEHAVEGIVAGPAFFKKAVVNYGKSVSDNFYLV
jgi:spore maturation protein CgeB